MSNQKPDLTFLQDTLVQFDNLSFRFTPSELHVINRTIESFQEQIGNKKLLRRLRAELALYAQVSRNKNREEMEQRLLVIKELERLLAL